MLGAETGQHPYLAEAECNALYERGAKRISGRCHLICQTSALNVDEVVRRSRHAELIGADTLMILRPYFEGPTDDNGFVEFYREIDAVVTLRRTRSTSRSPTACSMAPTRPRPIPCSQEPKG